MEKSRGGRGLAAIGKSLSVDALRSSAATIKDAATSVSPKDMLPSALLSLGKGQNGEDSESSFRIGTVVSINSTPYRVVSAIASGAYSQVFRCADRNGTEWALKRALCRTARSRQAANRELEILGSLPRAEGLMQLRDSMIRPLDSGGVEVLFLLHLCRGGALLDKLTRSSDGLRAAEIYKCIADCAEALVALHATRMVHWDLKLENILLADEGQGRAIIGDFGSTTQLGEFESTQFTLEEAIAERERLKRDTTPAYRAPEVVRLLCASDTVALTEKVDIWAIGCVIFALYFGRLPFDDRSVQFEAAVEAGADGLKELTGSLPGADPVTEAGGTGAACGDLPQSLRQILTRCLAAVPEDRPTAAELGTMARAALTRAMGTSWAAVAASKNRNLHSTGSGGGTSCLRPRRTQSAGLRRLHLRLLDEAANRAEDGCADCHADCPRWAALDFSVWICYRCARLHRWLLPGSRLQPVGSDRWTSDSVEVMCKADGSINCEWEQIALDSGATNPHTTESTPKYAKGKSERYDVERWILAKYWTSYTERRSSFVEELEMTPAHQPPPSRPSCQLEPEPMGAAMNSAAPTSTIRNQGYLTLYQPQAKKHKKQRQFFVLTDEVLASFRSEEEGLATMANLHTFHASVRANGVFDIGSVTEVNLVMEEDAGASVAGPNSGKSGNADDTATFKICLTGREAGEYLLEAQDHTVSLGWVHSIQTALLQVSTPQRRLRSPSAMTEQSELGLTPVGDDEGHSREPTAAAGASGPQLRVGPAAFHAEPSQSLDCEVHQQKHHEEAEDLALAFADDVADLEFDPQYQSSPASSIPTCSDSATSTAGQSAMYSEGVPPPRSIPSSLTAQLTASAAQLERAMAAVASSHASAPAPSTEVVLRAGLQAGLGQTVAEQTVMELLSMLGLDSSADLDRSTLAAALAAVNLGAAAESLNAVKGLTPSVPHEQVLNGQAICVEADGLTGAHAAATPVLEEASFGPKIDESKCVPKESWLLGFSAVDEQDRGRVTQDDFLRAIASGTLADCFPLGSDEELSRVDDLFAAVFGEKAYVTATEWSAAWERVSDSVQKDLVAVFAERVDTRWS